LEKGWGKLTINRREKGTTACEKSFRLDGERPLFARKKKDSAKKMAGQSSEGSRRTNLKREEHRHQEKEKWAPAWSRGKRHRGRAKANLASGAEAARRGMGLWQVRRENATGRQAHFSTRKKEAAGERKTKAKIKIQ